MPVWPQTFERASVRFEVCERVCGSTCSPIQKGAMNKHVDLSLPAIATCQCGQRKVSPRYGGPMKGAKHNFERCLTESEIDEFNARRGERSVAVVST